jgi:hypothetical protein
MSYHFTTLTLLESSELVKELLLPVCGTARHRILSSTPCLSYRLARCRGGVQLVQLVLSGALYRVYGRRWQSHTHPLDNHGWTMVLPLKKNMPYGRTRSAHVLVFEREDIFHGVLDLYNSCNRTILSRRALSTVSLTESSWCLWPFA